DFVEAYTHGIVVDCPDGVTRRFYPRIFTYSADYPERVKLATVRDKGRCPCPRCGVLMENTQQLGTVADMNFRRTHQRVDGPARWNAVWKARRLIYEDGHGVNSVAVERLLQGRSWVPTENAFSSALGPLGFNIHQTLAFDVLHEWEGGVWKSVFIHLLRLVKYHRGTAGLAELDTRYRAIPVFGRDTIRKFSSSVSELKQLAARDYEDLLQCAIPVFEGLLPPEDNARLLRLLFHAGHWHSLVKLRMHTDDTIAMLQAVTKSLGRSLRDFKKNVCDKYATTELDREQQARLRHAAKQAEKAAAAAATAAVSLSTADAVAAHPLTKGLNIATTKVHGLGDAPFFVRWVGTTDSYSTDRVELEHRWNKVQYRRTNRKNFVFQIIHIHALESSRGGAPFTRSSDPSADTPSRSHIIIKANRIYKHAYMTSHYTTYDVRRDQDSIAPNSARNIVMMLSNIDDSDTGSEDGDTHGASSEDDDANRLGDSNSAFSPYCYARVIGIFHAHVIYTGPGSRDTLPRRVEFLWVRWLEQEAFVGKTAWDSNVLEKTRYPPVTHPDAFGFMDPAHVLRGCHIMPAFAHGRANEDPTIGRSYHGRDSEDWNEYYVGRFVDRDMLMRHHWGAGVGHTYSHSSSRPSSKAGAGCEGHSLRFTPEDVEEEIIPPDTEADTTQVSETESLTGSDAPRPPTRRRRRLLSVDSEDEQLPEDDLDENPSSDDGSENDIISNGEDSELDDIDGGFD
ncbi:hypothetical protein OF83DRAFT_1072198, partial [Amylostereum chailletii]